MTSSTPTKAIPTPALLVYGKPTAPDLPQASWFRAEDRPSVAAAAQSLKFSVLDIRTEAERALTVGVHEGVLKGNGGMIVGSVAPEVYKRIEEHVAKASSAPAEVASEKEVGKNLASEQNMNDTKGGPATSAPVTKSDDSSSTAAKTTVAASPAASSPAKPEKPATASTPWETLRVGSRVLAAYWSEAREFEGFWLATVKRVEGGEFTLEWLESPEFRPNCRSRQGPRA